MSARDIARKALPSRSALVGAISLGVLSQGAAVALLATSAWLITRTAEQPPILYVTLAVVAVRAFAISRAVFRYLERVISHESAFRALAELRVWMYRRLVPLAPAGLQQVGRGSVLSAIVRDVDTLQDYPLRVIQPIATATIVSGLAVVGVGLVDPTSAGALFLALVLTGIVSVWWNRRISASAERLVAPVRATMADRIIDTVQRRAVLVAYGAESAAHERILESDRQLESVERRVALGQHVVQGLVTALSGVAVVAIAFLAAPRVDTGDLSGPLFALLVLTPLAVFEVFGAVPLAVSAWRGVETAALRIDSLVPDEIPPGIPEEVEETITVETSPESVTSLQFTDFVARWPRQSKPPFAPVSLSLSRGDRLLITGPSGVGKSTLASAMVGFVDYAGSLRINGVEAHEIPLRLRRAQCVLIEQRPHLFDTSIRHNLTFARPEATDEQLLQALQTVGLGPWLNQRGGLDAELGEAGALVSGGQAQRIALARAFLAEAPIVVLDEPTANVDRAVADQLMGDLLQSIGQSGPDIAIVISHVPVDEKLVTHKLPLVSA